MSTAELTLDEAQLVAAYRKAPQWRQRAALSFLVNDEKMFDVDRFDITLSLRYNKETHALEVDCP